MVVSNDSLGFDDVISSFAFPFKMPVSLIGVTTVVGRGEGTALVSEAFCIFLSVKDFKLCECLQVEI